MIVQLSTEENETLEDISTLLNVNDRKAVEFNKTKRSPLSSLVSTTTTTRIEKLRIVRGERSKRKEAKLLREYIIFIEIAFFSISIKHINPPNECEKENGSANTFKKIM
jgi:hypothetical protein